MRRVPVIQGLIRRRLLVNFRVDPEVMKRQLPQPFFPKLLSGSAVAGICLIRLERIRPLSLNWSIGLSSENAAHRVAVCWRDEAAGQMQGVYIPRRDSNSVWNRLAGGRLFPGEHHSARFEVKDEGDRIDLRMISLDSRTRIEFRGRVAESLPATSRFSSLEEASLFFEQGSLGYSTTAKGDRLDGLYLKTSTWQVTPLDVESVYSSFFSEEADFPKGSVQFDSALLMRDIPHEWQSAPDLPLESI